MQYLGRLKERLYALSRRNGGRSRPGARLYGATFGDQPCGTVVNAAPAPDGGSDLLAVVQIAAVASGDVRTRCSERTRRWRRSRCPTRSLRPKPRAAGLARASYANAMCLALFALDAHPRFAVVIAANRDEHHARPARPAAWWERGLARRARPRSRAARGSASPAPDAGRSSPTSASPTAAIRGRPRAASSSFACSPIAPRRARSVAAIVGDAAAYNGFNLLAGDTASACWGSNRTATSRALAPGIHGISNALLDTPWPKVARTKAALEAWCARDADALEALFTVLGDRTRAPDDELPATGVPLEWERLLSSPFIVGEGYGYGTRCSTVVAIGRDGLARLVERAFDPAGRQIGEESFRFALEPAA